MTAAYFRLLDNTSEQDTKYRSLGSRNLGARKYGRIMLKIFKQRRRGKQTFVWWVLTNTQRKAQNVQGQRPGGIRDDSVCIIVLKVFFPITLSNVLDVSVWAVEYMEATLYTNHIHKADSPLMRREGSPSLFYTASIHNSYTEGSLSPDLNGE